MACEIRLRCSSGDMLRSSLPGCSPGRYVTPLSLRALRALLRLVGCDSRLCPETAGGGGGGGGSSNGGGRRQTSAAAPLSRPSPVMSRQCLQPVGARRTQPAGAPALTRSRPDLTDSPASSDRPTLADSPPTLTGSPVHSDRLPARSDRLPTRCDRLPRPALTDRLWQTPCPL